ncbi:cation:proton antiporter [Treponema sp.]|uniref:cation:proton antiporter n=1 Tax=Treponema sp. TaxID=166 RepID=UPI0025F3A774|nr:cation:proton antiporter [Treponema sp.]MBR4322506.1 cation:proton antiporter [Treponema sp.]
MIQWLYDGGSSDSSVSAAIISISIILLSGFLMTRVTKRLRLPNVTAYIVAGILIGPFCLNLVPKPIIDGTEFLPDIALAFIAFSTGQFFRFDILKKNGRKVVVITLFEALLASLLVFILTFFVLRLNLAFSIVLAALAATTAPASTMMTIRQTGAKGDFVETLLQVVALDDIVGLLAYSVAISIALHSATGEAFSIARVFNPILTNALVLFLGAVFGVGLSLLVKPRSSDNRLIISVALLFAFCGICTIFEISPLLGCMSMGTVYINMTDDDKLFKQLNYFSPPFLLMFFVRSGMSFDLPSLVNASGVVSSSPLILIGVLYFIIRILGKYAGAFLGCLMAKKPKETRNYLGLALIPQAGVAIGLASLGARSLGGETGNALETIILASSVLYELIGPASAKLSLYLSKSYSTKLEDLVEVNEKTEDGKEKTQLQLLIDRIQKIQEELPAHPINESEEAFTEAAENSNIAFWGEVQKQNLKEVVRKRRKS